MEHDEKKSDGGVKTEDTGVASDKPAVKDKPQILYQSFCQLYCFSEVKWVERCKGSVRIFGDKHNFIELRLISNTAGAGEVRIAIGKDPLAKIVQHAGNDRAWCFSAPEILEENSLDKVWAVRFQTPELGEAFKKAFDSAKVQCFGITPVIETPGLI